MKAPHTSILRGRVSDFLEWLEAQFQVYRVPEDPIHNQIQVTLKGSGQTALRLAQVEICVVEEVLCNDAAAKRTHCRQNGDCLSSGQSGFGEL